MICGPELLWVEIDMGQNDPEPSHYESCGRKVESTDPSGPTKLAIAADQASRQHY